MVLEMKKDNWAISVIRPELTEEERAGRMEKIKEETIKLLREYMKRGNNNEEQN